MLWFYTWIITGMILAIVSQYYSGIDLDIDNIMYTLIAGILFGFIMIPITIVCITRYYTGCVIIKGKKGGN